MNDKQTRRQYLRAMAATGAATITLPLAGCSGGDGGDGGDSNDDTVRVEMSDDLVFDPDAIEISPGTSVVWETVGSVGHSVTAYEDELPDGAEYFASGGFDSEEAARDAYSVGDPDSGDVPEGETYEHTFETTGEYEYFCIPHESAGMVGTVTVS